MNTSELNEDLWIEVAGYEGRLFLGWNPHTFPGRMGAWSPALKVGVCVSKGEIKNQSEQARSWIEGFLAGNEPAPHDLFGKEMDEAAEQDPRWQRWRDAVATFRATGAWLHGAWAELVPFPPAIALPAEVWTLRGDEVWRWDGAAWARAEPQPSRRFKLLVGTVCNERGHCATAMVSPEHLVCEDCGATTFVS